MKSKVKTVYIAMSGGVDSSVAAALLKRRGFVVVGVFMKPWSPPANRDSCMWKEDREDALRVAAQLNIPLLTWDFSKEYKKEVADYMISEYRAGRTPNPDVECNREIKFGLFLKRALKEGADLIATGHYVRIKRELPNPNFQSLNKSERQNYKLKLLEARDKNKDQSYFLWTLTQKQLSHCLFPVGNYTKPQIRKLAEEFRLPTANKKDSQGVCFIGELNMHDFLTNYIKPKRGSIVFKSKIVGIHDGAGYYTIGQRHGLNIRIGHGPYYVIGKDMAQNKLFVGSRDDLGRKVIRVDNFSWLSRPPNFPARFDVRVRYRAKPKKASLHKDGLLEFDEHEEALSAGQSAVFYKGQTLVGGGIIS